VAGSTASYPAMELAGKIPQPEPPMELNGGEEIGPMDGPKVLSSVKLAETAGMLLTIFWPDPLFNFPPRA